MSEKNDRTKFIGASDVSSILGLNPWKTPLQLWSEKTGRIEAKDLSDNEAVEWGTRLERVVSRKFSEKHGVKLIARKTRYVHPEHDYISCELDNIIAGTDEQVEIKTVNAFAWNSWKDKDELPIYVIVQVMTQLGLSKRKKAWVACLCGGQKYIEKEIEFDQEMYDDIIEKCVAFWNMVKEDTAPMAIGQDNQDIVKIYPENDDQIQQVEEFNDQIALLQETKMHLKEMEKERDGLEASIKQRIGTSLGIQTAAYVVTWKTQERASVNTQQLKDDGLYEKYKKTTESRTMRVKKNKEQENG